jgi:hypothetical protein
VNQREAEIRLRAKRGAPLDAYVVDVTYLLADRDRLAAENERLREALQAISRLPTGHDCDGYCREMSRVALDALATGERE